MVSCPRSRTTKQGVSPLMLGDCSGPGAAASTAPRDPSEAPLDDGGNPAPAVPPEALMMRRLGSARDLVRLGRKLSRTGFDIGEQFTEKGSTAVAEVRAHHPLTARAKHDRAFVLTLLNSHIPSRHTTPAHNT